MRRLTPILYLFSFLFILLCSFTRLKEIGNKNEVIQLGDRREIFVDYYLIDKLKGTQIVKHTPCDEGPALYFEKPWEGAFSAYCTIIQNKDLYRVYYRGLPSAGKDGTNIETTCIAESKDGIHWEKPELGLYNISGSLKNNVILANEAPASHNFSPFLDANPNVKPDQVYKALAGEGRSGLVAYVSPDGRHWKKLSDKSVITKGTFDSQNVSFWSESEKCYVCYFRTTNSGIHERC